MNIISDKYLAVTAIVNFYHPSLIIFDVACNLILPVLHRHRLRATSFDILRKRRRNVSVYIQFFMF